MNGKKGRSHEDFPLELRCKKIIKKGTWEHRCYNMAITKMDYCFCHLPIKQKEVDPFTIR